MQDLPKIDAHHHLWELAGGNYPWLSNPGGWRTYGDYSAMCHDYLVGDFVADARPHNVVKSVHVQANWNHDDPVGETRWVQAVADEHGFPHAIVAHAALESDDVDAVLASHCEYPNVRGVRHILGHTDDPDGDRVGRPDLTALPAWERGYALLAKYALSFDLQVFPRQMAGAAAVAARHPDVPVAICHTGFPWDRSPEGRAAWRRGMAAFAEMPHTYVKLSGPAMVMIDWTAGSFGDFIHASIDLFGPRRCMFASNVPPDALAKPYGEIYGAFYEWASRYGAEERRWLFHDTAAQFYRI